MESVMTAAGLARRNVQRGVWRRLALCVALAIPPTGAGAADKLWSISARGYGPVKVGMRVADAERVLRTRLVVDGEGVNAECYHVHPERGHSGLTLMVMSHRIVRASLYGDPSAIRSDRGIALGDSTAAVLLAYGDRLDSESHKYGDGDHDRYLTAWQPGRRAGVRYEILGGRVATLHGGSPAIRLVEGCS